MRFREAIEVESNVHIVARDRGKLVPSMCRDGHNVWVNNGRQYLAEVISPLNSSFAAHYNDSPVRVVRYMGVGIGGDGQTSAHVTSVNSVFDTDYPGQNTYDDTVITTAYLERPVKVTGTAGVGSAAGVWMNSVVAPPSPVPTTKVTFQCLFDITDLHLSGAYPSVPLSEVALMLSSQTASRTSEQVYDYSAGAHPAHINTASRQQLIAYNTFDVISKTISVSLEFYWEIQF